MKINNNTRRAIAAFLATVIVLSANGYNNKKKVEKSKKENGIVYEDPENYGDFRLGITDDNILLLYKELKKEINVLYKFQLSNCNIKDDEIVGYCADYDGKIVKRLKIIINNYVDENTKYGDTVYVFNKDGEKIVKEEKIWIDTVLEDFKTGESIMIDDVLFYDENGNSIYDESYNNEDGSMTTYINVGKYKIRVISSKNCVDIETGVDCKPFKYNESKYTKNKIKVRSLNN